MLFFCNAFNLRGGFLVVRTSFALPLAMLFFFDYTGNHWSG
jgi:hypothetical protein